MGDIVELVLVLVLRLYSWSVRKYFSDLFACLIYFLYAIPLFHVLFNKMYVSCLQGLMLWDIELFFFDQRNGCSYPGLHTLGTDQGGQWRRVRDS